MARRDLLFCLALLLLTVAVYSQVARFDFVNYADPDYSTGNPHVRAGLTGPGVKWALTSASTAHWFPLTWWSHMLDYQFFGADPHWRHVINLALHIFNTLLLFFLLKRMSGSSTPSAFVAFVFALHPLHIESVAWIAERKGLLCTLFSFLTIFAYLRFIERPQTLRYLLMIVAFGCALLSNSMAVTLPFVLLLLDYWPLKQFANVAISRLVVEKAPMIAMSIAASIVAFVAQPGGSGVADTVPLGVRTENALVSYVVYILKFFWPSNLAVFYPYAPIPVWQPIVAAIALAGITAFVIQQRTKRRYLSVGWFWYLATLAPVIGLIQTGGPARADRYTYFPMIGIAIMLAWRFKGFVVNRKWIRPPLGLIAAIVCIVMARFTWLDLKYWRDSTALFLRAKATTQANYFAYSHLGLALSQSGHASDSIPYFKQALSIKPHFAHTEAGLGEALTAVGRFDEAMPYVADSVRLEPKSAVAHLNLGSALDRRGQTREAADQYRIALQLDPESPVAHCGLGVTLAEQGHPDEALRQLFESVRLDPDYGDGHYQLARLLDLQGRGDEAMPEFREAIRVQPSNSEAHYNLGLALAARERLRDALDEFRTAVELKPDHANARFGYATTLANRGNFGEAINQFEGLLRLKPDFGRAQEYLAKCIELRDHPAREFNFDARPPAASKIRPR